MSIKNHACVVCGLVDSDNDYVFCNMCGNSVCFSICADNRPDLFNHHKWVEECDDCEVCKICQAKT